MAERRMFAKTITESDAFLDMPLSSQALYLHLGMNADDDGFINNPKSIKRKIGAQDDDLKLLAAKKFIIVYDDGIVVIKHWGANNYIRADRKHETKYEDHLSMLDIDEQGIYHLVGECQPSDCQLVGKRYTEVRLGKVRLGKDKEREEPSDGSRFAKPSIEEVAGYIREKGYTFSAEAFCAYYESKGWMVGRNKMKDWRSACCTWQKREKPSAKAVSADGFSEYAV